MSSSLLSPFVLSALGLVGVVVGLPRHRPGSCGQGWAFQIAVAFVSLAMGCRIVVELSGSGLVGLTRRCVVAVSSSRIATSAMFGLNA
jgi:hypothetical protein